MRHTRSLVVLVVALALSLTLYGLLAYHNNTHVSKIRRSEPPIYIDVSVTYPYTQHIENNTNIYICETFNITINVSDDKGLDYLNISYDGHTNTFSLGASLTAVVEDVIVITGPGVYQVTIVTMDMDGMASWYIFNVICCDQRPPNITLYEGENILIPEVPIYRCNSTILHLIVDAVDGIDVVVVTIKRDGSVISNQVFDLSNGASIDTHFETDIEVLISSPGTYQIEIYAADLCQFENSLTYLIICEGQDKPPVIVRVTACKQREISYGGCVCCCNFTLNVIAIDDIGISILVLYVDGSAVDEQAYMPASTYISYSRAMELGEGIHIIEIVVKDTSEYADVFQFYVICDHTPPVVDVRVDGSPIHDGDSIRDDDNIIHLSLTVSDNVRLSMVQMFAQSVLIETFLFPACGPNITTNFTYTSTFNATEYVLRYTGLSSSFPILRITIIAMDACGNQATFYFIVKTGEETTLTVVTEHTIGPGDIVRSPGCVGVMMAFGIIGSMITLIGYRVFLGKKP